MGSPLGPALANIITTELKTVIVKPLINSGKIVLYKRYVDDTLVLAKPSDIEMIEYILNTFNTIHSQIQFTVDKFPDNDIHFLDSQTLQTVPLSTANQPILAWSIPTLLQLHSVVEKDFLDTCPHSSCPQNFQQR